MAKGYTKKIFMGLGLTAVLAVGAVAALGYFLTRPLPVSLTNRPNAVEAQEADRKLKLLSEAQSGRKQGFVRFSEVEINSFLDGKYHNASSSNSPVRLVKAGILLDEGQVTVVTWHEAPIFGFNLPFVWQRVVTPVPQKDGWSFAVRSMSVGQVQIPEGQWPRVGQFLGATDSIFQERKEWLRTLPMVTLAMNEESDSPEVRLYTYLPRENSMGNETASK
ncbi:MAG: hypothetical protein ACXW32_10225 [Limisphaerales bacterium]